ncbi:transcriptional regulator [Salmonella enterica]|nr:transcriptional regulator [Salmonella enterica]EIR4881714.1 transcriptional regulator [Salmonella enterica]
MGIREAADGQKVIIYGDCWPEVSAVQHVVEAICPECCCKVADSLLGLLQYLTCTPEAVIILCLRPREHIYLFYVLKQALLDHPALVISDELLFSDRLVLNSWGGLPFTTHPDIIAIIAGIRRNGRLTYPLKGKLVHFLLAPSTATGYFAVPLIFNNPERLMNYMSLLMHRAIMHCGITPAQQKLLNELYKGKFTLSGLAGMLDMSGKKISQEKERILTKLGMNNRMYGLLHGTRFCPEIQKTPFISPADAKNCVVQNIAEV